MVKQVVLLYATARILIVAQIIDLGQGVRVEPDKEIHA